jgi:hypothetical protein
VSRTGAKPPRALGLRKRAFMLVMVIIVVIAAVVVYIVRMVRPKRVRLRAGVGKFTILDFEADGGDPPHGELKELLSSDSDDSLTFARAASRRQADTAGDRIRTWRSCPSFSETHCGML